MGVVIIKGEGAVLGGKFGTSHCNQRGLSGVLILCHEEWQHGSSQITLEFFIVVVACVEQMESIAAELRSTLDADQLSGTYN